MMRFLVDNSLPARFAAELRVAGHAASHVRDFAMGAADDEAIFDLADRDHWILLAQDTDFGTILARRATQRPSVVLFRRRSKSVEALIPMLIRYLASIEADLSAGAVVVFEDARIRVRRLPIGARSDE